MRKALLLTLLAFFTTIAGALAQVNIGVGLSVLKPQGAFAKNIGTISAFGFDASFRFKKLHLETGLSGSLSQYYKNMQRVPYIQKDYPYTEADRLRNNNLNVFNFFARYYPLKNKAIQPYIDSRIGITSLTANEIYTNPFRSQNIDSTRWNDRAFIDATSLSSNLVLNYGGGIGLQADILKLCKADPIVGTLIFDMNVLYLHGNNANYLNMNNNPNPIGVNAQYATNTSMLMLNFGLKASFFMRNRNAIY